MIGLSLIPAQIRGSHAGGAVDMFQSELRVTANSQSVYPGFFTHFCYQAGKKKRARLRRGRGRRVPRVSTLMHLDGLILQF